MSRAESPESSPPPAPPGLAALLAPPSPRPASQGPGLPWFPSDIDEVDALSDARESREGSEGGWNWEEGAREGACRRDAVLWVQRGDDAVLDRVVLPSLPVEGAAAAGLVQLPLGELCAALLRECPGEHADSNMYVHPGGDPHAGFREAFGSVAAAARTLDQRRAPGRWRSADRSQWAHVEVSCTLRATSPPPAALDPAVAAAQAVLDACADIKALPERDDIRSPLRTVRQLVEKAEYILALRARYVDGCGAGGAAGEEALSHAQQQEVNDAINKHVNWSRSRVSEVLALHSAMTGPLAAVAGVAAVISDADGASIKTLKKALVAAGWGFAGTSRKKRKAPRGAQGASRARPFGGGKGRSA